MCPKWNRKGFEVVTTQGQEKPDTQSVVIDIEEVDLTTITKVSLLGVESLWGDCAFIPADLGS